MTKEELKQEAKEYISDNCKRWEFDGLTVDDIANEAYLASAEPREKRIADLEKENAELKKFINAPLTKGRTTTRKEMFQSIWELSKQITNAKELILRLYNAGRDVLMCRAEEKAYDNLSNAINDKSIEQFLSEAGK